MGRVSLLMCNSALLFKRPGAIPLFFFFFHVLEQRTGLTVSPDQTVLDGGQAVLRLKPIRKETGFLLESYQECVWETCVGHWNLLKEKTIGRVQSPHHGREELVFVIRNAIEKVRIVSSPTDFVPLVV